MTAVAKSPVALSFAGFRLDLADERLWGPNGPIKLGNKAFRVLAMLAEQEGRLLTKDDLFSSVWDGTIVSEAALTSVIKEIRRALGDESRTPRFIESVYGRGYRFLAEVRPEAVSGQERPQAPERAQSSLTRAQRGDRALLYIPAFDDATMPERQRHLSIVLREEILSALSRFHDIRLVSDTASEAAATGRVHGDRDYQLSVRLIHDGQSVRAFARIGRLATQAVIWADHIDLPDESLGQSVEQLVRKIVAAALPRLQDDVLQNIPEQPQGIYDQYLLNKLKMRSLNSLAEARRLAASWEELIERDPGFAQSYGPLIRLYNTDFAYSGFGASGEPERRRAYELAHQAITVDPTDSHLHTVKGWCHLWAGESAFARLHLREALDLNPYNKVRLNEVATALIFLNELDRARELLDRCNALTPFATEAADEEEGLLHLMRHEYDLAAARLALARRSHPEDASERGIGVKGELYGLLAAAGSGAADLGARARRWQESMIERWAGVGPPTQEALRDWVAFHNPLQDADQREHFLSLLDVAFKAAPRAKSPSPAPATSDRRSAPGSAAGRPASRPKVPS
jgi:DNA-binding winged helix-turn-helix (wHTH) protein